MTMDNIEKRNNFIDQKELVANMSLQFRTTLGQSLESPLEFTRRLNSVLLARACQLRLTGDYNRLTTELTAKLFVVFAEAALRAVSLTRLARAPNIFLFCLKSEEESSVESHRQYLRHRSMLSGRHVRTSGNCARRSREGVT
jgi:hypothetical protein